MDNKCYKCGKDSDPHYTEVTGVSSLPVCTFHGSQLMIYVRRQERKNNVNYEPELRLTMNKNGKSFPEVIFPELQCECGKTIDLRARLNSAMDAVKLTNFEKSVCVLVFKGLPTKEISGILKSKDKRIKYVISTIFCKFHVQSRSELSALIFPV